MKKIVTTALVIFVLIVGGIFVSGYIFNSGNNASLQNNQNTNTNQGNQLAASLDQTTPTSQNTSTNSYTLADVTKHNTSKDCWMTIDGKVYDFTTFLQEHPGGMNTMTPYCGKDGTEGFTTMDKKRAQDHSAQAYAMLKDYYKGDLK